MQVFSAKSFLKFGQTVRKIGQIHVGMNRYIRIKNQQEIESINDPATFQKGILFAYQPGGGLHRYPPG